MDFGENEKECVGKDSHESAGSVKSIDVLVLEDSKMVGLDIEPDTWAKTTIFNDTNLGYLLDAGGVNKKPVVIVTPSGEVKCITYDLLNEEAASFQILDLNARPNRTVHHLGDVFNKIYNVYEDRGFPLPPVLVLRASDYARLEASTNPKFNDNHVGINGISFRYTEALYRDWRVVRQRNVWDSYTLNRYTLNEGITPFYRPPETQRAKGTNGHVGIHGLSAK
ncbi:hypothetical protein HYU06_02520 [Candidatus Woesearchaeota archaeon]|nr:hypothetical protein [Candidatus Woesearchaeota archaeon]